MRPICLKISAFGPYAGEYELPMEQLGKTGLYLITGDTGAGKTTIFDAIVYALFGEASGDVRDASMLRSKYADDDAATEVAFTFSYLDKIYHVKRNPAYERRKKSGKGNTLQLSNAELIMPDGQVITQSKKVTEKITEILGVNKEQFSQIAMIAQGEFRKLLLADTKNRQEIFRNIFRTDIYQMFQKKIAEESKSVTKHRELVRQSIRQYLEGIQCDESHKFYGRILLAKQDRLPVETASKLLSEMIREDAGEDSELLKKIEEQDRLLSELNTRIVQVKQRKKMENDLSENRNALAQAEIDYRSAKEAYQLARTQAEERPELERRIAEEKAALQRTGEQFDQLKNAGDRMRSVRQKYISARKETEKALADEKRLGGIAEDKRIFFYAEQAGIMAESLAEGEPCPVCGSTVHPEKARKTQGAPTEAEVQKAEKAAQAAQAYTAKISAEAGRLGGILESSENAFRTLLKNVFPDSAEIPEDLYADTLRNSIEKREAESSEKSQSLLLNWNRKVKRITEVLTKAEKEYHDCETKRLTFQTRCEQLEKQIAQAEKTKDQDADIAILTERYRALYSVRTGLYETEKALHHRLETNRTALSNIEKRSAELSALDDKWKLVSSLSNTANGLLSGKEKITLETWIQGYYFDRILGRANVHFLKMSGNQYELKRTDTVSDLRSTSGLELDVIDHYNGSVRSVKTLSGGESFLASLSLALGMSEEVQVSAGGIRLDCLFVDEGFGTLDEETLQHAMRALQGLTAGNRLVGIVSHVSELRREIEKQIVVTKQKSGGSRVELRI